MDLLNIQMTRLALYFFLLIIFYYSDINHTSKSFFKKHIWSQIAGFGKMQLLLAVYETVSAPFNRIRCGMHPFKNICLTKSSTNLFALISLRCVNAQVPKMTKVVDQTVQMVRYPCPK